MSKFAGVAAVSSKLFLNWLAPSASGGRYGIEKNKLVYGVFLDNLLKIKKKKAEACLHLMGIFGCIATC